MAGKIIVSGVGCCLVDILYNGIDFGSDIIHPYLSKKRGDGGLTPGKLVFQEEFEKFCENSIIEVLNRIAGGRTYDKINVGGPSIVPLVNLAQLADKEHCEVRFYGRGGNDDIGEYLLSALKKTPVVLKDYMRIENRTPSTVVLSDPSYDNGHGERMFLNSIGAAWDYRPDELDDDFFSSDIVMFGGTALVPQIHDNMTNLLKKARYGGCTTVVNTVFDFRNERINPLKRWPLGESDESYRYIDLLITDREEALRLSGENDPLAAVRYFREKKVSALIITNGSRNILVYSDGRFFESSDIAEMPVSLRIIEEIAVSRGGDTTGCGDNFAGGVMASVAEQLYNGVRHPDLREACCWGLYPEDLHVFTWAEPGSKKIRVKSFQESDLIMNPTKARFQVDSRKIVIFGAGRIGRSFIGQLFGKGGYKVVFVDINPAIVNSLNSRKSYRVIIKGEKNEEIIVSDVQAILASETEIAAEAVSSAGILAVSVGKNSVEKAIAVIASGLELRYNRNPECPLDIIIAENMIDAGAYVKDQLKKHLPLNFPVEKMAGLIETSIGKMVPIMTQAELEKDPVMICAEPYNTLILDAKGFKSPIPDIEGLAPKDNIKAWVDRKAFIHNLGHTTAAWFGHFKHPMATFIYEVLDDIEVYKFTREVMIQSAGILSVAYKNDFTASDLEEHIDDLLIRFRNKALKDTIYRVGHDLVRKLGSDDRFAGAIHLAELYGKASDKILEAMSYGICFRAKDEEGKMFPPDYTFLQALNTEFESVMSRDLHLDLVADSFIISQLKKNYRQLILNNKR
jgi:mannitol-1-phosphate 5-dehydrogenase